jgi:hypothetical protein
MPVQLDLTQELVGQRPVGENTYWGNSNAIDGDFNLFGATPNAPIGTWYFTLSTASGSMASGEVLQLSSMVAASTAVPEPAACVSVLGAAVLAFSARRRSRGGG